MSETKGSNPIGAFVESRMKYRTLRPQFVLAAVAGIVFAGNIAAVYALFGGTGARQLYGGVTYALGVVSVFAPFMTWVGATTATFLLARLVGARVEFGVLLRSTGWGIIPLIGASASLAAGRYLSLQGTDVCSLSYATCDRAQYVDLTTQVETLLAIAGAGTGTTVFLVGYALATACFLLAGYVWYLAAYKSSTLTRQGAALTTAVPVAAVVGIFTLVTF